MKIFGKFQEREWQIFVMILTAIVTAGFAYMRTLAIEERKILMEERKFIYKEFFEGTAKKWRAKALRREAEGGASENSPANGETEEDKNAKDAIALGGSDLERIIKLNNRAAELEEQYNILWHTARFKMGVLSKKEVVEAVAHHFRRFKPNNRSCRDDYDWDADIGIYEAIREEFKTPGEIDKSDMAMLLFSCDYGNKPSKSSPNS